MESFEWAKQAGAELGTAQPQLVHILRFDEPIVKTPTQPQHNLIQPEVGFDTIIAVHTTPPPPPGTLFLLEVKVLVVWNFLYYLT